MLRLVSVGSSSRPTTAGLGCRTGTADTDAAGIGCIAAVPMNRMNRTEFFDKLSGLDEQRLKTALWNLYWRGTVPVREHRRPTSGDGQGQSALGARRLPWATSAKISDFFLLCHRGEAP